MLRYHVYRALVVVVPNIFPTSLMCYYSPPTGHMIALPGEVAYMIYDGEREP